MATVHSWNAGDVDSQDGWSDAAAEADKLRVLFLESQATLTSDSQVHRLLIEAFDRDRIEVHMACNPGHGGQESRSFATLKAIPGLHARPTSFGVVPSNASRFDGTIAKIGSVASLLRLAHYVRRRRIQVIHAASRPRDAACAVALAKLTGTRSVIHLHVMVSDWFSPLLRWALKNCDGIVGISEFVCASVADAGYSADKTHKVLNSLDASEWDPSADRWSIRDEFGIARDAPLLAIVSRLFSWKGHDELLKALVIVREQIPGVRLLIVGEDDRGAHPTGGSYRAELEARVVELGLGKDVIFTGFREDVESILAACDVYAMPSFEEPLGMAFLEAMAMEKPVVALRSGGVPEIVEHGRSGLLSDPGDVGVLASNILSLLNDERMRRDMGLYGRARVQQHHDPGRIAQDLERAYRQVAATASGNRA